jgi:PEP-CTERM motif-containing protein
MKAFACTFGVILAAMTWSAPAAALQITFDDLASVGNPLVTTVETHGYRLAGPFLRTTDTPGTTFVVYGFSASGLFAAPGPGSPNASLLAVIAMRVGGGGLSAIYDLGASAGFVNFPVPTTWTNLEFVTFAGIFSATTAGGLALDDIGVGLGPSVPEPATIILALTTMAGLAAATLRRRRS